MIRQLNRLSMVASCAAAILSSRQQQRKLKSKRFQPTGGSKTISEAPEWWCGIAVRHAQMGN